MAGACTGVGVGALWLGWSLSGGGVGSMVLSCDSVLGQWGWGGCGLLGCGGYWWWWGCVVSMLRCVWWLGGGVLFVRVGVLG